MRSRLVAACVAAAAALAGCGAEDQPAAPAAAAVGPSSGGSTVQYADCGDWRAGSVPERRATVEALRGQLTPQSSKTAESSLSDERAYAILQKACTPDFAESLRLYKLYVRAQAFAPLSDE